MVKKIKTFGKDLLDLWGKELNFMKKHWIMYSVICIVVGSVYYIYYRYKFNKRLDYLNRNCGNFENGRKGDEEA
jgi:hypothetical protein